MSNNKTNYVNCTYTCAHTRTRTQKIEKKRIYWPAEKYESPITSNVLMQQQGDGGKPNLLIDSAMKCQLCRNRLQRIVAQTYEVSRKRGKEGTKWKYLMIILVYCKTMNGWWWWRWWWSTSLTWIILQRHFTFFSSVQKFLLSTWTLYKKRVCMWASERRNVPNQRLEIRMHV